MNDFPFSRWPDQAQAKLLTLKSAGYKVGDSGQTNEKHVQLGINPWERAKRRVINTSIVLVMYLIIPLYFYQPRNGGDIYSIRLLIICFKDVYRFRCIYL